MKKIIFLIFLMNTNLIFSNDTFIFYAHSGSPMKLQNNTDIKLLSEIINITLNDDFYEIEVEFNFYNSGPENTVIVGFPKNYWSTSENIETENNFIDFITYVNNEKVDFELKKYQEFKDLNEFFTKEVKFLKNKSTQTRINYKGKYSVFGGMRGKAVPYLYGTGKTWGSGNWGMEILVNNNYEKKISRIQIDEKITKIENFDKNIKIKIDDVKPVKLTDSLYIILEDNFDDIIKYDYFWDGSDTIFDENELKYLTNNQLRLLRNIIFAKHGYIFKSKDLSIIFNETDWYKENPEFTEQMFNEIEKSNIDKIIKEEKTRK